MIYLALIICGAVAWLISTVAAGGAATLLIPVIGFMLGAGIVAPVISLAAIIANPSRVLLFHKDINWSVITFLTPGSFIGAIVGAWLFSQLNIEWLQIILGLFLISYVVQVRFSRKRLDITFRRLWFLPIGMLISFLSGLVGATGPVLNPFLLAYGLQKEELVATKSVNSLIMQLTKLTTYSVFGALTLQTGAFGIALGIGALIGVYIAKLHLITIKVEQFNLYVHTLMFASGVVMLLQIVL